MKMFMNCVCGVVFLGILWCGPSILAQDCDTARQIVQHAFDLGENPATFQEQKRLLTQALRQCPESSEAHNNLAWIYGQEQQYAIALHHYQEAVHAQPDYVDAWYGLGDAYQQLKQFPLSLEAYLHVCTLDHDAKQKALDLLKENRYQISEEGDILNKDSLLLLFHPARRANLNRLISECGFKADAVPEFIFRNILFDVGKATLKTESLPQLEEIGAAVIAVNPNAIIISGHTDKQPFKDHTPEESLELNQQLSEDRAKSVATELARLGVPVKFITTHGYGQTQPLIDENIDEAYQQNRRVTIEVR